LDEIEYPSMEELEELYDGVTRTTGGEHGYLSKGNLEYLLDTVKDVGERYPKRRAIIKKAAFLLYNIVTIHPLANGNKRTAYELVRLFLRSNGFSLSAETREAYNFLIGIASGKLSETEVESWIATHLSEPQEE